METLIKNARLPLAIVATVGSLLLLTPGVSAASNSVHRALGAADAPRGQLEAASVSALPSGTVVTRYAQEVGGVPVQDAGAVVLNSPDAPADLLFDKTAGDVSAPGEPQLSRGQAVAAANRAAGVKQRGGSASARLVLASESGALAWEVLQPSVRPLGDFLVTVDATTGAVISKRNLIRQATGQAKLFNPNPVVSNDGYSGLKDRNDKDSMALNSQRVAIDLENLTDAQACLEGDWVNVRKSSAAKDVCRESLDWTDVKRKSNSFEALMAYAHMDRAQLMIQALDLAAINEESQNVIANSIPDDNSFYLPSADRIELGTGGVDDGEDADVIVHEYGHAVQDDQNPPAYRGNGNQVGAQGEGFGDYLADAYSTEMVGFDPEWTPCVMEWDATSYDRDTPSSPGICLRRADNPNTWDEQKDVCGTAANIHCIGEVWASALLDLRTALGDDAESDNIMDTVVLAAHELTPPDPTFQEASAALLAADLDVYAGAHCLAIEAELTDREFFTGNGCV